MNKRTILFIFPKFNKIGGVELTLLRYMEETLNEVYLFEAYTFKLYRFKHGLRQLVKVPLFNFYRLNADMVCIFFWQLPFFHILLSRLSSNLIFFVNSTIHYTRFKNLGFRLGLKHSTQIIADGDASYQALKREHPEIIEKVKIYDFAPSRKSIELVSRMRVIKDKEIIFVGRWSEEKGVSSLPSLPVSLLRKLTIVTDKPQNIPLCISQHASIIKGNDYLKVLVEIKRHKYMISLSPKEGNSLVLREAICLKTAPLFMSFNEYSNDIYKHFGLHYPENVKAFIDHLHKIIELDSYQEITHLLEEKKSDNLSFVVDFDNLSLQ